MDRAALIAEIEKTVKSAETVRNSVAARYKDIEPASFEAVYVHELTSGLSALLGKQPELKTNPMLASGAGSWTSLLMLLPRALWLRATSASPAAAVDWLESLLSTAEANAIFVMPLWGVDLAGEVQLSDTVRLVPWELLPDSPQRDAFTNEMPSVGSRPYSWVPPKAALVEDFTIKPLLKKDGEAVATPDTTSQTRLNDIRLSLSLCGPRTLVPGRQWAQYISADLAELQLSPQLIPMMEIEPRVLHAFGSFDASKAQALVRRVPALEDPLRAKVHLSLDRFDRGLRRSDAGDAALEFAIALESLLGDSSTDLTYKVALRSALLAGGKSNEKISVRDTVQTLYGLRSTVVHTGRSPDNVKTKRAGRWTPAQVMENGARVAASVISAVIDRGNLPDWFEFEIGSSQ